MIRIGPSQAMNDRTDEGAHDAWQTVADCCQWLVLFTASAVLVIAVASFVYLKASGAVTLLSTLWR